MASNPGQAGTVWTPHELYVGWLAIAHVSPAADAATLNAQTYVAGPFNIGWTQIRGVLMGEGTAAAIDWGSLTRVANTAVGAILPGGGTQTGAIQATAIAIQQCCLNGETLRSSDATVWGIITAAGTTLSAAAVGGLSAASSTAIGALRAPTLAVWSPTVGANDIASVSVNHP